jgi:hypothetical protein
MSDLITVAFVNQFQNNITMLYQQLGSKLRGKVQEKSTNGEYEYFERLARTAAVKKTVRHGDTPQINSQHSRRRGQMSDYEWADLIDKVDEVRMLINPTSAYAQSAAYALGRAYDQEVIAAFTADSQSGKSGTVVAPFPSSQVIVHGSTGLTLTKLRAAKTIFNANDVPMGMMHMAISAEAVEDLLSDTTITSADFNTIKTLIAGEINTFMGFTFTMINLLPLEGTTRTCYAWHMDSMGALVGADINTRVSERDDKSYSTQVYASGTFGAVRIQDEGVVAIEITE